MGLADDRVDWGAFSKLPPPPRLGGEVDTIFGLETKHDALEWIREKSQSWLLENQH